MFFKNVVFFDLTLNNKFKEGADFYIDEIQQKYDSMEYKDFPDSIAHYFQCHRHFDNILIHKVNHVLLNVFYVLVKILVYCIFS